MQGFAAAGEPGNLVPYLRLFGTPSRGDYATIMISWGAEARRRMTEPFMTTGVTTRATLDDLYREEGKAELIGGRIVRIMPSGDLPGDVAEEVFISLRTYAKVTARGIVHADGAGVAIPELPSGRESFSPDASY